MAFDAVTYVVSRGYTDRSILGIDGALAGKNCTIEKVEEVEGGQKVTFKWTADTGEIKRHAITVANGVGIEDIKIEDEHLIFYLSDGKKIDCGEFSGVRSGIWIGSTTPPSKDYVLWIDPKTEGENGIPTADKDDIDLLWP